MSLTREGLYEFGPFRLNPPKRLLLREGQPVALPPKAYDLLVTLVAHAGRLVTREESAPTVIIHMPTIPLFAIAKMGTMARCGDFAVMAG